MNGVFVSYSFSTISHFSPSWKFEYLHVPNENSGLWIWEHRQVSKFSTHILLLSKPSKVCAGEYVEGFTFSSLFNKKHKTPGGFCFSLGWQTPLQCPCPLKQSRRKERAENKQVYLSNRCYQQKLLSCQLAVFWELTNGIFLISPLIALIHLVHFPVCFSHEL